MTGDRVALDGAKVRALRIAKGLTQTEVARRAGLTRSSVCQIERAHRVGRRDTVAAIATVLGVDDLAELAPPPPGPTNLAVEPPTLRPRLDALLDDYDAAERGSEDALLAALIRATVSAHGAIGRRQERDEARAALAEARAS